MVVASLLLPILNAPLAALQEFEIVDLTGTGAMVLNWFVKPEEVLMLRRYRRSF
jgi:hypothetical protein